MSAAQFEVVGGGGGTLSDLFSATDIPFGTEVRLLNERGQYEMFTYLEEAYDEDLDDYVPGWADGDEYLVKTNIANEGQGFWIKSDTATTITFSNPTAKAGN